MNVNHILTQLANNTSRTFKLDLLQQHREHSVLRETVRLALCPLTQFWIRQVPAYQPGTVTLSLGDAFEVLDQLSQRTVTGHAARDLLAQTLSSLTADDAAVVCKIIAKDLRCGVSVSTANRIWPGLVFEYPVMLASNQESSLLERITWPACAQIKLDGMRANIVIQDGTVTVYSRSGRVLDLHGVFDHELAGLPDQVIDGELLVRTTDGTQLEDRKTGNGILNRAVKGTCTEAQAQRVVMHAWDRIDLDCWKAGVDPTPYVERFDRLTQTVAGLQRVELIQHSVEVHSLSEAQQQFEQLHSSGEEGIILKDWHSGWQAHRSRQHIKFKGLQDADLEVVGVEPGTGRNLGRLGALICETRCGQLRVNVGTGFSDAERDQYGENLIGRIVTVQYNEKIRSKTNDQWSLFLPRFDCVREDKNQANSLEELL